MSKKTFCIDNVENIPSDIINMICSEKSEFHSWFHDDDGTNYIKSDHSIIYRNEKAAEIFELLRNYLGTCIIRAYHATRIIDDQEIIIKLIHRKNCRCSLGTRHFYRNWSVDFKKNTWIC